MGSSRIVGLAVVAALLVTANRAHAAPARARTPVAVVLVIDRSGSMTGTRMDSAKLAAKAARATLGARDQFAVIGFDAEATTVVALGPSSRRDTDAAIDAMHAAGGTNIYPGLVAARAALAKLTGHRRHIVVISDGQAPYDGIADLVTAMNKDGITVSTIGTGDADRVLLKEIAEGGAGRLYMTEDPTALRKIVLHDLAHVKRSR